MKPDHPTAAGDPRHTGPQTAEELVPGVGEERPDGIDPKENTIPEEYTEQANVPSEPVHDDDADPAATRINDGPATDNPDVPADMPGSAQAAAATAPLSAEDEAWRERYLRLSADFDNFRKRTNKEKDQLVRFANEQLLKSILPVVDDLERALRAAESSENIDALRQGLSLVHRNFTQALQRQGIEPVEALGQPFDSERHEAVASLPVDDAARKGTVIDVFERGFTFHGKVIRYAKVVTGE